MTHKFSRDLAAFWLLNLFNYWNCFWGFCGTLFNAREAKFEFFDRTKNRPFWQNLNLRCDNFHGPKITFQRISHCFLTDYLLCNCLWKELDFANRNLTPRLTLWKSQYPRLNNIKSSKNVSNHFYWLFDIYFLFVILGSFGKNWTFFC